MTILATEVETVDSIERAEAEERLSRVRDSAPKTSDSKVRESHRQDVQAAKRRLQLAKR